MLKILTFGWQNIIGLPASVNTAQKMTEHWQPCPYLWPRPFPYSLHRACIVSIIFELLQRNLLQPYIPIILYCCRLGILKLLEKLISFFGIRSLVSKGISFLLRRTTTSYITWLDIRKIKCYVLSAAFLQQRQISLSDQLILLS